MSTEGRRRSNTSAEGAEDGQDAAKKQKRDSESSHRNEDGAAESKGHESAVEHKDASHEESAQQPGDEKEDEDTWWYLDAQQNVQGPFTWEQMEAWFKSGYLQPDLPVMRTGDEDFATLHLRPEFRSLTQEGAPAGETPQFEFAPQVTEHYTAWYQAMSQQQQQQFNSLTVAQQQQQYRDYAFTANFNATTGRFQAMTTQQYFGKKGVPADPAGRQLAHYFDIDAYQEQKRMEKEMLGGKPKKVKNWRELKEAKKTRKQKNYVKNLLKD